MKLSICIPFHWMDNWQFFMERCLRSIEAQTFKDYEVVMIKHSNMPITSNRVIESAKGEIIKVLYMDDYLAHGDSLQEIVDNFKGGWLVSGCLHDNGSIGSYHSPSIHGLEHGQNTIGSPSVLAFENNDPLLFDPTMSWLLDIDLYCRLQKRYGQPTILDTPNVIIGIGPHQMTNKLTPGQKLQEENYLKSKYE